MSILDDMRQSVIDGNMEDTQKLVHMALAEDMPAMASNSLSVSFGNFEEGYTIVDRIGLQVLRDPYTAAPFVKFRCSKRVGGDVVNFEAIKVLKFAAA